MSAFAMLGPVILIDGRIAGTWQRTLRRGRIQLQTRPLRPLTRAETAALAEACQRYRDFLGLPASSG
jgi:hypothetical protein